MTAEQSAVLTFSDSGITETSAGSGYTIDGTTLTITTAGTYRISGSCSEGAVIVGKGLSSVTLVLDNLTLASSTTAPIVVKKSATANIHLVGTSTLTDNEDPANETSTDTTIAEAFEGAAIKVKSGSTVTFCGDGDLNVVANAKNGIKGGATASLIFNQSGTINVSGNAKVYGATTAGAAVNNGIACDGSLIFNQGTYVIKAANDGVNAAGGSSSGTDPGAGGGNTFNPGGRPGGPGGGGFNPGGGSSATTGNYNIYIYGGDLYVNCDGDGLDSNGGLYLYGGTQAVFSMRSGGDNSAIDADGTVSIQGASVFTAGTTGMDGSAQSGWFGSNQKYYASKTSYSAGKIINTKAGSSGSVVFSYALPKAVNYIMASYPSTVSANTPSFATATSVTACKGGSWSHTWNSGSVSNGVITYTCTKCGATEKQTVPATVSVAACDHSVDQEAVADEGYTISFAGDSGVSRAASKNRFVSRVVGADAVQTIVCRGVVKVIFIKDIQTDGRAVDMQHKSYDTIIHDNTYKFNDHAIFIEYDSFPHDHGPVNVMRSYPGECAIMARICFTKRR